MSQLVLMGGTTRWVYTESGEIRRGWMGLIRSDGVGSFRRYWFRFSVSVGARCVHVAITGWSRREYLFFIVMLLGRQWRWG